MKIRTAKLEEISRTTNLAQAVFMASVATLYSKEGVKTFLDFANPESMIERMGQDYETFVAIEGSSILGMAHVRNPSHISMLFVSQQSQRKGVGRALINHVIARCEVDELSVNSSPNAEAAYFRFGFRPTDEEQTKNGIRFIPMTLRIH